MINKGKIVFDEPIYYMPNYGGTIKISVLKLLDGERVLVKQYSKDQGKDFKPFSTRIADIYNRQEDAARGRRAWEQAKKKRSKSQTN